MDRESSIPCNIVSWLQVLYPMTPKRQSRDTCNYVNNESMATAKKGDVRLADEEVFILIGPVSGSRYMARLRATGADWGLDTRIIF